MDDTTKVDDFVDSQASVAESNRSDATNDSLKSVAISEGKYRTHITNFTPPRLNMNFINVDNMPIKIILLTDRKLKRKEMELLTEHFSVYEVKFEDHEKHMSQIPCVECYVVPLISTICSSRSWGSIFYDMNRYYIMTNRFTIVYYRTLDLMKKENIKRLYCDYVLKTFPTTAENKTDLKNRLFVNSGPHIRSRCGVLCSCIFSNITIADACAVLFNTKGCCF